MADNIGDVGCHRASLAGSPMKVLHLEHTGLRTGPDIVFFPNGRAAAEPRRFAEVGRRVDATCHPAVSTERSLTRRFEAKLRCQPVVKGWPRTETGEAPRGQGATTENTGSI